MFSQKDTQIQEVSQSNKVRYGILHRHNSKDQLSLLVKAATSVCDYRKRQF